ncbi:hypothetical protein [Micromonospora echinofusca]|uniref:Excreted virulence factor EspC, type VII ESX diderm n=1 Tax=Micromonospora echinofusca TaxID=47858 RepID=A0ABS3VWV9_MICEH|nr:hypothetical protein [Micromonospora echinofusca]MBO4209022.1 hypothetical protein [Micromonospora echinofusca]
MSNHGSYTFRQVQAAILPGRPATLSTAVRAELVSLLDCLALSFRAYGSVLTDSATALSRAQSELAQFAGDVGVYRAQMAAIGVGSDEASIDAEARGTASPREAGR